MDTLRHALDSGLNFIETSDIHGPGHNEELVGRIIAGRRKEVVLASKSGRVLDGSSGTELSIRHELPGIRADGRPDYPRTTRRWQVDENPAAAEAVLDAEILERIGAFAPPGPAVGPELV